MKRFFISTVLTISIICQSNAGQPFTSSSTGYDWNSASDSYRHSYCEMIAGNLQSIKPGVTGQFLYDSLSAFYNTNDSYVLKQKITQIIGATVAVSGSE